MIGLCYIFRSGSLHIFVWMIYLLASSAFLGGLRKVNVCKKFELVLSKRGFKINTLVLDLIKHFSLSNPNA